jgi:hypothetical protein
MANQFYPKWKESLLTLAANNDIQDGTVKLYLIDTGSYTYSSAHQFVSSLTGVTATSGALTGKTITNGVFDSNDPTFSAVTGAQSEALVMGIDTGSSATSPLVMYLDTGVTGLPVTPNSGDIGVVANASGWFTL